MDNRTLTRACGEDPPAILGWTQPEFASLERTPSGPTQGPCPVPGSPGLQGQGRCHWRQGNQWWLGNRCHGRYSPPPAHPVGIHVTDGWQLPASLTRAVSQEWQPSSNLGKQIIHVCPTAIGDHFPIFGHLDLDPLTSLLYMTCIIWCYTCVPKNCLNQWRHILVIIRKPPNSTDWQTDGLTNKLISIYPSNKVCKEHWKRPRMHTCSIVITNSIHNYNS